MVGGIGCAAPAVVYGTHLQQQPVALIAEEFTKTQDASYAAEDAMHGVRIWIGMKDWMVS